MKNPELVILSEAKDLFLLYFQRETDRGREDRVVPVPPPSEPDRRVSRIRLSSWWSYLLEE
jgi:hypothetical protein